MAGVRKAAQAAHQGAYAAPLANLDSAEQAARDVAARRQADNKAHAAWVLGQQGKLAAIGQGIDQRAAAATAGVQAGTLHGNQQLMGGMQAARQAQGIQGPVPSQQLAGLSDDAARQNLILGAATQRGVDRANTNAGKAGFVGAAALANMNAQSRAIAGDEFNQVQSIRREKTGLLADEANATMQAEAARAAAAADIVEAEMRAAEQQADRDSRERIAGDNLEARRMEGETDRAFRARQNSLNRRAKLRASGSAASGGASREDSMKYRSTISTAAADARHALANSGVRILDKDGKPTGKTRKPTEAEVRAELRRKYKDADVANTALDLAIHGHVSSTNEARLRANHGVRTPRAWKPKPKASSSLARIAGAKSNMSQRMPRG